MDRRDFVRMGLAVGGVAAVAQVPARVSRASRGDILDAGVREQQQLMAAGKLTSHALTSR